MTERNGSGRTPRRGFTLVEAIVTLLVVSILFVGLIGYFGTSMRHWAQQESTLTGSRDAQILIGNLRQDLLVSDGTYDSSSATTGTTFPKRFRFVCHHAGSDALEIHDYVKGSDTSPLPMDLPFSANLPEGPRSRSFLEALRYVENAFAAVGPAGSDEGVRWFTVNTRAGETFERVTYAYDPAAKLVERHGASRVTRIALPSLQEFSVLPVVEVLTFPGEPARAAEILKVWLQVRFTLKAPQDGAVIARRPLEFSTLVTPRYLNAKLRSFWNR